MPGTLRSNIALGVGLLLAIAPGCYTGLGARDEGGGAEADGGDAAEGDEGGDDGGPDTPPDAQCEWPDADPTIPIRRLTKREYDNSIRDLFGLDIAPAAAFVDDTPAAGFRANTIVVSELQTELYIDVAESIAEAALAEPASWIACDLADPACADDVIVRQGRRIFRRDLTVEEHADYGALYDEMAADGGPEAGLRQVIAAMLASPNFLYLARRGATDEPLQGAYTLAARLSYFLWSTTPDDALLDAAAAGELDTLEGVDAQVRAMLADDRAAETLRSFAEQWLQVEGLPAARKNADAFPQWNEGLAAAMVDELQALVADVVLDGDGTFASLLLSPRAYVNAELADLYGVPAPANGSGWVELPAAERGGLLTRAGFLAAHAHESDTSIVKRGVVVQTKLLCVDLPPPPDDIELDPEVDRLDNPACSSCHRMTDPIGMGLESYDAIGQWSDAEASGEVVGLPDGTFSGGAELSSLLAGAEPAAHCITQQWFRFAHRREIDDADECTLELVQQAMVDSGGDIREAIVAVATSDSFRFGIDG